MTDRLDCVVVGAGVIGLAIARSLALAGREVVVLEAEPQIGSHTSSRNSEVIHAGIYYPTGSLKARLCVSGREMLYRYCEDHHIAHQRIGKLIVAANENGISTLHSIDEQARTNGVTDLQLLSVAEIARLEPNIEGESALLSPSTGIVDSHELMIALRAEIESNSSLVVCNSRVIAVAATDDGFHLTVAGAESNVFICATLVNAAGLWAQSVASSFERGIGDRREHDLPLRRFEQNALQGVIPQPYFSKGQYFAYPGKSPFQHLIYPLPFGGKLGIHATNDLSGAVRFGPDAVWVDAIDYEFDEGRKREFVKVIRQYFPGLDASKLVPAYAGIRPNLSGPGGEFSDFVIQGEADHGIPGLVNLFGIESPGLTASLAIGRVVNDLLS